MRNIKDYEKKYMSDSPFEDTMVKIRKRMLVEQCEKFRHNSILEIGCGLSPFFLDFHDFSSMYIVEPGEEFVANATNLAQKENRHIEVFKGFLEEKAFEIKEKAGQIDFIILSSLLHELEEPEKMLKSILDICDDDTVVHINVPNANSLHRLIAVGSGIINDSHEISEQMIKLQRKSVFDKASLRNMIETTGFELIDEGGGCFIKPFTHLQLQRCIDNGIIDERVIVGMEQVAKIIPDYAAEIFVNVKKAKKI